MHHAENDPAYIDALDRLYRDDKGWAYLSRAHAVPETNGLEQRKEHYFRWPQDREKALGWIERNLYDYDLLFAPLLRGSRSIKKGSALAGRWLIVDLDKPPRRAARRLLDKLTRRACLLVASGGPGRQHLYVELSEAVELDELESLNRRLAQALGGDSRFTDNAQYRVPGTFNFKRVSSTNGPTQIKILADRRRRTWPAAELAALLPPPPTVPAGDRSQMPVDWQGDLPPRLVKQLDTPAVHGERSDKVFAFVMTCIEHGMPVDAAVDVAYGFEPAVERGKVERDVRLIYGKHDHVGRSCRDAGCADATYSSQSRRAVDEMVVAGIQAASQQGWTGRDDTRRRIINAAGRLVLAFGEAEFDMAEREFALAAGISRTTFSRQFPKMEPLLLRTKAGTRILASSWRLVAPEPGPHPPHPLHTSKQVVCGPTWGAAHDAFLHGGLGGTARRIYWEALASDKKTVKECASELRLSTSAVGHAMRKLRDHGCVKRLDDARYVRVDLTEAEWREVAATVGKLGRGERQESEVLRTRRKHRDVRVREATSALDDAQRHYDATLLLNPNDTGYTKFWRITCRIMQTQLEAVESVAQQRLRKTTLAGDIARDAQQSYGSQHDPCAYGPVET